MPESPTPHQAHPLGASPARDYARCPACGRGFVAGTRHCSLDRRELVPARGVTLIGDVVGGRYEVQQLVGSGGMGEVYRARHMVLDRVVALKVIRADLTGSATAFALLAREARNAGRVEHPNAVRTLDLETHGGVCFVVMEYVPGPNLADVVDASGPLSPRLVAEVVAQVALGLEAIHAVGIVHRDLKPSNVVLTRTANGRGLARLLDFGISRAFGEPDQALTGTGLTVGTPGFMSPEQRAALPLDGRADVFSLAVLATYLLAGRLPDLPPIGIVRLNNVPQAREWPQAVRQAIESGLQLEHNQRPATARAFSTLLRDSLADAAGADGRPETIEAELRRERWSGTELAGVVLPAAPPAGPVPPPSQTTEKVPPVPRPGPVAERLRGPRVEAISGPLQGQVWAVTQAPLHLGRDPRACQLVFPAEVKYVSRIHASVRWDPVHQGFVLQDEGSSNFTFLGDGRPLVAGVAVPLAPGATFSLGTASNRFRVRHD